MTKPQLREKFDGAPHSKQSLRLWLRLLSCSTLIEKRMRQLLIADFDTTLPRFDVMSAIDRFPQGLTMGELSDMLLVSNGNVTAIVSRLVEDGLADRNSDTADRRISRIMLTAKGQAAFKAMAAKHEDWIDHIMGDLTDREIEDLLVGLDRVRISAGRSGL